jgi:signal transduction histidine kinase/ABC-type amino acid transport substrate-binding protein/ActR/RegA family two-component response regulator
MIKTIFRRALLRAVCLFTAAALICLYAAPAALALQTEAERRHVRVAFNYVDNYQELDADGRPGGYAYEYLQNLLLYTNWEPEYVGYDKSWKQIQDMLENGELDLAFGALVKESLLSRFEYSKYAVATISSALLVRNGAEGKYTAGDYGSYNGMRIGVVRASPQVGSLMAFAAEKGFSYVPVQYPSFFELEEALRAGEEIEAAAVNGMNGIEGTYALELFDPQYYYAIVKKGNAELLSELDYAMEQVSAYQAGFVSSLYDKYFGKREENGGVIFTPEELDFIRECEEKGLVFDALTFKNVRPFCYYDENGALTGFLYDIARLISEKSGLNIHLRRPPETSEEYGALVNSASVDLVLTSTMNYNAAEETGYKLTEPYYRENVVRLVRNDRHGEIKNVTLMEFCDISDSFLPTVRGDEELSYCESTDECVQRVLSRESDAAYLYSYTAQLAVYEDFTNSLSYVVVPGYQASFSVAINAKEDTRLASIMQKAVKSLRDEEINSILRSYSNFGERETNLKAYIYANPMPIIAGGLSASGCALVIVIYVWQRRRRRSEFRQMTVLSEKNAQLQDALYSAEKANAAKGQFTSRVSHEIRTPLNAVIGYNTLAQDIADGLAAGSAGGETVERLKDCLEKADFASKHLLAIINDVLDLSTIESGKMQISSEPFDLGNAVSSVTDFLGVQAREKRLDLITNFAAAKGLVVKGDEMRLNQIITNLLSNAIKFTPSGGTVKVSVFRAAETAEGFNLGFIVEDTGIGMSEEFLGRLFQPYEQQDSGIARNYGGTGLGLSITKNLVNLMGGSIEVESEPGKGSRFTVLLPFAKSEPSGARAGASAEKTRELSLDGLRVLLVEDNEMNLEIAGELLKKRGMLVDEAENGQLALDKFLASPPGYYAAVLMDVQMPVMDGCAATRAIRASDHPDAKSVPILAMSADAFAETVNMVLAAGMNGHIAKPVDVKKLYEALEDQIEKRK